MQVFIATIGLLYFLGACVSLQWLSRPELPQPGRRTREGIVISLLLELTIAGSAAWLLFA